MVNRVIDTIAAGEFACYTYNHEHKLIRLERKESYAGIFSIYNREKRRLGQASGGMVLAVECDHTLPEKALIIEHGMEAPFAFAYSLPEIDLRSRLVGFIVKGID